MSGSHFQRASLNQEAERPGSWGWVWAVVARDLGGLAAVEPPESHPRVLGQLALGRGVWCYYRKRYQK